jgi:hypothetical protein
LKNKCTRTAGRILKNKNVKKEHCLPDVKMYHKIDEMKIICTDSKYPTVAQLLVHERLK